MHADEEMKAIDFPMADEAQQSPVKKAKPSSPNTFAESAAQGKNQSQPKRPSASSELDSSRKRSADRSSSQKHKHIAPELSQQPTHPKEFAQDGRRMLAAVSGESDKYALVEPYLMTYEQPVAIAVQRKFPFSVFADIVLVSTHRLMVFSRFFTKIDMFDANYVDIQNVRIKQGFFTSCLTFVANGRGVCTVPRLITDQALNIYRICQDIETKARIARRQFQLEENRSRTTTMQVNNLIAKPDSIAPRPSQTPLLPNRDLSNIGEEESDPYRLGE